MAAVSQAMQQTPRASSLVENQSRLRITFSSVVNWVPSIWTYYSFSSTIARLCAVSVPNEWETTMTGQPHAHWLELLGFERFQRA